jgi:hypothetical protein
MRSDGPIEASWHPALAHVGDARGDPPGFPFNV